MLDLSRHLGKSRVPLYEYGVLDRSSDDYWLALLTFAQSFRILGALNKMKNPPAHDFSM